MSTLGQTPCQILMKPSMNISIFLWGGWGMPDSWLVCGWQWCEQRFPSSIGLQRALPLELEDYFEARLISQASQFTFSVFFISCNIWIYSCFLIPHELMKHFHSLSQTELCFGNPSHELSALAESRAQSHSHGYSRGVSNSDIRNWGFISLKEMKSRRAQ